jgi:hypothetical protein
LFHGCPYVYKSLVGVFVFSIVSYGTCEESKPGRYDYMEESSRTRNYVVEEIEFPV